MRVFLIVAFDILKLGHNATHQFLNAPIIFPYFPSYLTALKAVIESSLHTIMYMPSLAAHNMTMIDFIFKVQSMYLCTFTIPLPKHKLLFVVPQRCLESHLTTPNRILHELVDKSLCMAIIGSCIDTSNFAWLTHKEAQLCVSFFLYLSASFWSNGQPRE